MDDCNFEPTEEVMFTILSSNGMVNLYPNDTAILFIDDNEG